MPHKHVFTGDYAPARVSSYPKLVTVLIALLAVAVAKNLWEAHDHQSRLTSLRCDEPIFNFGQGFVDGQIEHVFRLVNENASPVQIDRIVASCGCTTVASSLNGATIGPNEAFDIPVVVRFSDSHVGDFEREVIVGFAGAPRMRLRLKVTGLVSRIWNWSSEFVLFKTDDPHHANPQTITLHQHPDAPNISLPAIRPSKPFVEVEFMPPQENNPLSRDLLIRPIAPLPAGRTDFLLRSQSNEKSPLSTARDARVVLIVDETLTPETGR